MNMKFDKMFTTIDTHTAGEPLRIITNGVPKIKGDTQLEKRAYCMEHLDELRRVLMYEPRGHDGMYGCIMTEPSTTEADIGVLFMHKAWSFKELSINKVFLYTCHLLSRYIQTLRCLA